MGPLHFDRLSVAVDGVCAEQWIFSRIGIDPFHCERFVYETPESVRIDENEAIAASQPLWPQKRLKPEVADLHTAQEVAEFFLAQRTDVRIEKHVQQVGEIIAVW
ncbi:MAG: hypothetical protein ABI411_12605 [Tahibacter sp.]